MTNGLFDNVYNPDVLSCLANLSNDEVFTPPDVVNQMLDMLPQELFESPETTFLDPACKTGVFLREIAKRLLEKQVPHYKEMLTRIDEKKKNGIKLSPNDELFMQVLQEHIDHIFHHQLYGIAITELTSLLSRRGLYCSKYPNSEFSVTKFDDAQGNIRYKTIEHTWVNGKCKFCGASKKSVLGSDERGKTLEAHAYEWIHTNKPEEIWNMKFDVIISNPPYQLSTGGSLDMQATPIYNKFVDVAKKLNPRYISMIIPSRWMNGGFALDSFREEMINDRSFRVLHDFLNADECFAGISLTGGVCYFLRERGYDGVCKIYTHEGKDKIVESDRFLKEDGCSTFIRFSEAISILHKIKDRKEPSFSEIVSQRDPFGLNYYENGTERMFKPTEFKPFKNSIKIYYFGWQKNGIGYVERSKVETRKEYIDKYKIFISKANGAASKQAPYAVISQPFVSGPGECCNMTYLCIGGFDTEEEALNCKSYITTKFFRFLVSLLKNTQNALKKVYEYVPMQDFSRSWTDDELYTKYKLTSEEIEFIEELIKPMDENGGEEDAE